MFNFSLLYNYYSLIPLCTAILLIAGVDTKQQFCLLRKRYDQSTQQMRWSMPTLMRCMCDAVMISHVDNTLNCHKITQDIMWFTDNHQQITHKSNWTPEKLDQLLDRQIMCGKYSLCIPLQ